VITGTGADKDGGMYQVYMTWTMSFEQLSPLAALAFLHHNGISKAMFQNA